MTTVFIRNQGPGPITVVDASGLRTDMGEETNNLFVAPVSITTPGGAAIVQTPPAPVIWPNGEATLLLDERAAEADLAGEPRPPGSAVPYVQGAEPEAKPPPGPLPRHYDEMADAV